MYLLATILCWAFASAFGDDIIEGNYNVNEICSTVKAGTLLGSIASCDYYYVCTPNGPVKTSCAAGYSYNVKTASCAPSSTVSCYKGVEITCQGKTGANWIPVAGSCNKWTYCVDDKAIGSGFCGTNNYFDGDSQSCKHGICTNQLATGPSLRSLCDVVQPNMYFGNAQNCQSWNYCKDDGVLITDNCPTPAYIVSIGKCGYDTTQCKVISNPVQATGCVEDTANPLNNLVADPNVCGTYYQCSGTTKLKLNCPTGNFFDVNAKKCVLRQDATPVGTCNRCQYTSVSFVNGVSGTSCNTYYNCKNGNKNGDETSCPTDFFFNEDLQGCAKTGKSTYIINHGACKADSETETSELPVTPITSVTPVTPVSPVTPVTPITSVTPNP